MTFVALWFVLAQAAAGVPADIDVVQVNPRTLAVRFTSTDGEAPLAVARLVPAPDGALPAVEASYASVTWGEPVVAAGVRLARLVVAPQQGAGATEVRLTYSTPPRNTGKGAMGRLMARLSGLPEMAASPDGYLVIVPDDFYTNILPLAAWKTRLGFAVTIKKTSETGSTREQIRQAIQDAYHTWPVPPSYVLLVGAVSKIPAFTTGGTPSVTDHPFACVDGDDYLADLFVGRLPAANASELDVMVAKIVSYESSPETSDPSWFRRALMVGTSYQEGGTPAVTAILTKRLIRERLLGRGFEQIDTIFYPPTASGRGPVDTAVNRGVLYLNGRGWGNYDGWGYPQFLTNDVYGLNNGWRLPVVTSIYCGTGNYARNPCFGEAWLRAGVPTNPKGAVAFWGSSWTGTSTRWNNCMDYGIYSAIFDRGENTCAAAMYAGKLAQLENFPLPDDSFDLRVYFHVYNLLGDPALGMWTGVPQPIVVTHPQTFPPGTSSFEVSASVPGARVCLHQSSGTHLVALTGADGRARFTIAAAGSDTMLVTVTGRDLAPYLGRSVPTPVGVFVGRASHSPETVVPGAAVALSVGLRNFGTGQTAGGVTATLRSLSGAAAVTDSVRSYGDIAPGGTGSAAPYAVSVAPSCTSGRRLGFEMAIRSGDSAWTAAFELAVNGPTLVPARYTVHDANGTLDPGETAELSVLVRNTGALPAAVGTARLRAVATTGLVVTDSVGTFGTIAPGDSAANTADRFAVRASDQVAVGRRFTLRLVLSGTDGFEQWLEFPVTIGSAAADAPTGPDRHGYYAYDDTDTRYAERPAFDWLELDPAHGGNGTRVAMRNDTAIPLALPFTFRFYGRDYNSVSVCDNGYLAMGDAWFGEIYNWHIPSANGPDGFLAAYWDDFRADTLDAGVFWRYDAGEHRFVVQWSRCYHVHGYRPPSLAEQQTFQAILYDPAHHPTRTGDGPMTVQMLFVQNDDSAPGNSHNFATVGVQSPDHTDGLEYTFAGAHAPGAAVVGPGRAIRFTTNPPDSFIAVRERRTEAVPQAVALGPNPVRGRVRCAFDLAHAAELRVHDAAGRLVLSAVVSAGRQAWTWDLRDGAGRRLPAGVYRLALTSRLDGSTIYSGRILAVK
ncbi:MAG: C25 family cysteine peptidase [bacterium]